MMTFEQLLKKAAEEANEHELVTLDVQQIRSFLDGHSVLEELDSAMDWAQGAVHSGENAESWILIKIVK
jgi:hypothetical protein